MKEGVAAMKPSREKEGFFSGLKKIFREDDPFAPKEEILYVLHGILKDGRKAKGRVEIPEGVIAIGKEAFAGNTAITAVMLPASIKSIGERAFAGCTALTDVYFPAHMDSIGKEAFRECTALTSAVLPEGITGLEDSTFFQCKSLKRIQLPESLRLIGLFAFEFCESLQAAELPEGLEYIGQYAFSGCSALRSLHLPASLKSIDITPGSAGITGYTVAEDNPMFSAEDGILYTLHGTCLFAYPPGKKGSVFEVPERVTQFWEDPFCGCFENLRYLSFGGVAVDITDPGCGSLDDMLAMRNMLRTHDFSADVWPRLKFPFLLHAWQKSRDDDIFFYLQDSVTSYLKMLTGARDVPRLEEMLGTEGLITAAQQVQEILANAEAQHADPRIIRALREYLSA